MKRIYEKIQECKQQKTPFWSKKHKHCHSGEDHTGNVLEEILVQCNCVMTVALFKMFLGREPQMLFFIQMKIVYLTV